MTRWLGRLVVLALITVAGGCGGGGSGGGAGSGVDNPPPSGNLPGNNPTWTPGVFQPAHHFARRCAAPRPGMGDLPGRVVDENNWLRSWSHDLYLWFDEIVDRDPALYSTPEYFDQMKTTATTPSGTPKDNFHFSMPTDEWESLAGSGIIVGYGVIWAAVRVQPPRIIRVAYTEPNSPAAQNGLRRGERVMIVDGIDVVNDTSMEGIDGILAGLFPAERGSSHTFTLQDRHTWEQRVVTMTADEVVLTPVPLVRTAETDTGNVGYLLFNDHVATAELALIEAIETLAAADVVDLVLDLRYNSGGFLDIASQLAYMIAGPSATANKAFEIMRFSRKHQHINPVTGQPLAPIPFLTTTVGLSAFPSGQPLPALSLERVFVLTGEDTCSASESIMNALRGIGLEIIQIGARTCGKPYGFYPAHNCGTTYFSIQFEVLNHTNEGGYVDGFAPSDPPGAPGVINPGCDIGDDFERQLGETTEARFAHALIYRQVRSCAAVDLQHKAPPGIARLPTEDEEAFRRARTKPQWLQNRTLLQP